MAVKMFQFFRNFFNGDNYARDLMYGLCPLVSRFILYAI